MGEITKAQYDYWSDKGQDEFSDYMSQIGFDGQVPNKDIPKEAQFEKEFFEYEDICPWSWSELASSSNSNHIECDKDGHPTR